MSTIWKDFRYAVRRLRAGWVVTGITVVSLGLAIGGNTVVFSIVNGILFLPLPYQSPERLVLVGEVGLDAQRNAGPRSTSLATYTDLAERSRTLTEWGAIQISNKVLRGTEASTVVAGGSVTPSFFTTLGVSAERGRTFLPEEAVEGAPKVVMVSHEYWVDDMGDVEDPVGSILTVDGGPHEVVGVLPEGFHVQGLVMDLLTPITESPYASPRSERSYRALARMAAGATMEQVRAELSPIAAQFEEEYPDAQRGWTFEAYNMRTDIPTGQTKTLFFLLQGSVFLALLIACVNTFNLLMARGQERAKEIALRTALGAQRSHIVRQLFTESSLLVILATALGLSVGAVGIRVIGARWAPVFPPTFSLAIDGRVLGFTLAVSAVAGLLFGLIPALRTFQQGEATVLKEGGGGGRSRKRRFVSRSLVVAEIALSFLALGGGSLLVRSFLQLRSNDPGFDSSRIVTARINIPLSKVPDDEARTLLHQDILETVRRIPGVANATLTASQPLGFAAPTDSFRIQGVDTDLNAKAPTAIRAYTGPAYLDVMEGSLRQGRFFEAGDREGSPLVVVVNQSFARARFPGSSPVGARMEVVGEVREIVGVVGDIAENSVNPQGIAGDVIYLPVAQNPSSATWLVMGTTGDPQAIKEPLRLASRGVDADLAFSAVRTVDETVARNMVGIDVFNALLGGFGVMALILAALGTYGVLSYSVVQRTHEIGIRMSLGSTPQEVTRLIAREGIAMGAVGLVIGAGLTVPLVGLIRSLLQGLSTVDPGILALVAAVLALVTGVATIVPAARAAAVEPVRTLKGEGLSG